MLINPYPWSALLEEVRLKQPWAGLVALVISVEATPKGRVRTHAILASHGSSCGFLAAIVARVLTQPLQW
jgi:hypothetical protein